MAGGAAAAALAGQHGACEQQQQGERSGRRRQVEVHIRVRGIHARGQGVGIGIESQAPLAQESDSEGDEEDTAHPASCQRLVPAPDHNLGHAGHVGRGGGADEPQENGLVQGDSRQDQEPQGGKERPDGDLAADSHVTHVNNHA
jgi:hypothetical protein